ncbi:hypothetical protein BABINDRAFT_160507 [Babjeviella inositovora NRRL Y-12698]|uniref:Hap4 transcription factor heteromerisation domain-containing protein n=1 Tax=Babjeviella inositovora NRRL Y-12698 TaxID=984486 RepID=A0A1E3QTU1_9ASCO|nr:uncharacterized protein BABINDRAFT_160507 [Babjeviella inositovora NRRL Y-12698]ODQ81101.1 hypothetical protein BABINDRAFT_160507 [Babjeviella inositovora NRRL Y-12698]
MVPIVPLVSGNAPAPRPPSKQLLTHLKPISVISNAAGLNHSALSGRPAVVPTLQNYPPQQHGLPVAKAPDFVVKTSKKWVLPPRPKPGRKPVASEKKNCPARPLPVDVAAVAAAADAATGSSSKPILPLPPVRKSVPFVTVDPKLKTINPKSILVPVPGAGGKAPAKAAPHDSASASAALVQGLNGSIGNNPLSQAILTVDEENFQLRNELIKLVSDFNILKSELTQSEVQPVESRPGYGSRKRSHDNLDSPLVPDTPATTKAPGLDKIRHSNAGPLVAPVTSPFPATIEESLREYLNLSDNEEEDDTIGESPISVDDELPSLADTPSSTIDSTVSAHDEPELLLLPRHERYKKPAKSMPHDNDLLAIPNLSELTGDDLDFSFFNITSPSPFDEPYFPAKAGKLAKSGNAFTSIDFTSLASDDWMLDSPGSSDVAFQRSSLSLDDTRKSNNLILSFMDKEPKYDNPMSNEGIDSLGWGSLNPF